MPVKVEKQGNKFRVIESDSGAIALNAAGTPVDGGGHNTEEEAEKQAVAINSRKSLKEQAMAALQAGLPGVLSPHRPCESMGGQIILEVGLSDSAGPFSGLTAVPPGVLELVPSETLAALRDSRELFWTPFVVRASRTGAIREEVHPLTIAAAARAVVRPLSGGGYGVSVGSKRLAYHKTCGGAAKCAAARNRMARGGLPADAPEELMHEVVKFLEARTEEPTVVMTGEATTPGDSSPHWHWVVPGASETGIPSDARDDHFHPVDPASGEVMERDGHSHPPPQPGGSLPHGDDPAPVGAPSVPPKGNAPTV